MRRDEACVPRPARNEDLLGGRVQNKNKVVKEESPRSFF